MSYLITQKIFSEKHWMQKMNLLIRKLQGAPSAAFLY